MKFLSIILIVSLIKCIRSQDPPIEEPMSSIALQIADKLKTYSISSIGDRHSKIGFDNLKIGNDVSTGDILVENIDRLIDLWFKNKVITDTTIHFSKILSESLQEYVLSSKTTKKSKINFDLSFRNNDGGSMSLMNLEFSQHPTNNNILLWKKYVSQTSFDVSADTVVVTNSDCDIFKCVSRDSIVALPKYITYEHVEAIMKIHFITLGVLDNVGLIGA